MIYYASMPFSVAALISLRRCTAENKSPWSVLPSKNKEAAPFRPPTKRTKADGAGSVEGKGRTRGGQGRRSKRAR
jgi:hypothetical protein